eukprot:TRINITY_DN2269_c0_g3_i1.p1 TRINITY_DN2269_c0_g3~~TRINITY_DN2269_c0_g3_i1.p1  ORF type:complete len:271 (-),score=46.47 TRINITY_DN2269_c0_g3_i1:32-844(-)
MYQICLIALLCFAVPLVHSHSRGPGDCYETMPEDMCFGSETLTIDFTYPATYDACGNYTISVGNSGIRGVSVFQSAGTWLSYSDKYKIQQSSSGSQTCLTHAASGTKSDMSWTWTAPDSDKDVTFNVIICTSFSSCQYADEMYTSTYSGVNLCPEIICGTDTYTCSDGSIVSRDPDNGCAFEDCPSVCAPGTIQCADGSTISRDPDNNCNFPQCPSCETDTMTCDDGTVLSRNISNSCQFPECPVITEGEGISSELIMNNVLLIILLALQ